MAVEYKGAHLYESEETKRTIGAIWAGASDGNCLFCMPTDKKFAVIDESIG